VIFCSDPRDLHFSYKRFVENEFRRALSYENIPILIVFRERTRMSHDERMTKRSLLDTWEKDLDEDTFLSEEQEHQDKIEFDDELNENDTDA
jgi:GTP-binding protein